MERFIALGVGYCFGLIHPALFLSRKKNIDLSNKGSKNFGTSNVTIVMGWKYGVITALVDVSKSIGAYGLLYWITGDKEQAWWAGVAAILGHIFPFYNAFKGGKGMASLIGLSIALSPLYGAATVLGTVLLTLATGYIAIPSIVLFISFGVYAWFSDISLTLKAVSIFIGVYGIVVHRMNIRRILKGEETHLYSLLKKRSGKTKR